MLSLKCLIKWAGLPLVLTFKALHLMMFLLVHFLAYEGLKFLFLRFPDLHTRHFGHLVFYFVEFPDQSFK